MAESEDDEKQLMYVDDEKENSVFRWMSAVVVLFAVAGFFGLAWYAYKSGSEGEVADKDVELVKADKAPVKEAPANPGGMQIPNQDKTIYGLVNGNKGEKPTVERILPPPEEPLERGASTETWMSDKAKSKANLEAGEQKMAQAEPAPVAAAPAPTPAPAASTAITLPPAAPAAETPAPAESKKVDQFNPQKAEVEAALAPAVPSAAPPTAPKVVVKPTAPVEQAEEAPKEAPSPTPPPAPVAKPVAKKAPVVAKSEENEDSEETVPAAPPKGIRVQLGAHKSQEEATSNWAKLSRQFAGELKGKNHYIVRVDLGDKGIYYRLQVAPFTSTKEAEQFCLTFVSADKGCFPVKAK